MTELFSITIITRLDGKLTFQKVEDSMNATTKMQTHAPNEIEHRLPVYNKATTCYKHMLTSNFYLI